MNHDNNFNPLTWSYKNTCFEVKVPKYLRDKNWAESIGLIQDQIDTLIHDDAKNLQLIFNFDSSRWIDPLPLMSIFIEAVNAKNKGANTSIVLPYPYYSDNLSLIDGPYQETPNRLLLFLAKEGFLDGLCKQNISINKPKDFIEECQNIDVKPSYEDSQCISMRLLSIPRISDNDFANKSVENLITGVDSKLSSKIPPHARERLIYKVRVALQEFIHNVQEHAYEEEDISRLIAIYVRYRTGGIGLNLSTSKTYNICINEEYKYCPNLNQDWLVSRPGCLEIFVMDRGIGIINSFIKAGIKLDERYPLREVMFKTFYDGHSTKMERQSLYGGLHMLYNLLIDTGDFIRTTEKGAWFGSSVPIIRPSSTVSSQSFFNKKEHRNYFKGLAIHLRLGWKEETDHGPTWAQFEKYENSEIWPELKLDSSNCENSFDWFKNQTIIDERFGELIIQQGSGNWILWLVRPHRMKWDIISFIDKNISIRVSNQSILIIADIPSYEAALYTSALDSFKTNRKDNWPEKFKFIILSTTRWRYAAVAYKIHDNNWHGFSELHQNFNELRVPSPPILPAPANFRLAIVRWLKWYDSIRLWREIKQHNQMFIPEQIIWGTDENNNPTHIAGYLDFSQTTHIALCANIYRISLARILGILPSGEFEFYSLDRITKTMLRDINASDIPPHPNNTIKRKIAIGSVLVSGSTLKSSSYFPLDLHFFIHSDSQFSGSKPSLLFWLPQSNISTLSPTLKRIGKTTAVAPEGWKSFEVPRFDANRNCIGGRNPSQTYQDFQSSSPTIVKIGHWTYEGHHDFITINIPNAIEAAFIGKNQLARFIIDNLLSFIGLDYDHISKNWQRLTSKDHFIKAKSSLGLSEYGLLIYRSHPSSDFIIRTLLDILTSDGRIIALSRIFPILPVRIRWGSSTFLIPPLLQEKIKIALSPKENQIHPVLIFDDACNNGRTLSDLKASIKSFGARDIRSIVIANRLRQPADGIGDDWIKYYWRYDVPVMGYEGNCPLCHALDLIIKLSCLLVPINAKKLLETWVYRWKDTSPLDNWSSGLNPLPLTRSERNKKYCYRINLNTEAGVSEDNKYLTTIDLIRSTGLIIHMTELHTMTGRDDYCLKKINEHTEPEINIEIAASQLFLFGNEFDLDIRFELVKTLLLQLFKLNHDSLHTPLAFLSIISGLNLLDKHLQHQIVTLIQNEGFEFHKNYALKILASYFVSEKLVDENTNLYKTGKRLLSAMSMSLAQRFNVWFLEILSPHGNAHSESIPILINELNQHYIEIKPMRIRDALDSLDILQEIVNNLEMTLVRKEVSSGFSSKKDLMCGLAKSSKMILEDYLNHKTDDNWYKSTLDMLINFIDSIKSIADCFFYRIPSTQNYHCHNGFKNSLLGIIEDISWDRACMNKKLPNGDDIKTYNRIIKISANGEFGFDNSTEEVWIVWHRFIVGILRDLLRNAVYSKDILRDPWDQKHNDTADLWIRIDYFEKAIEITLANTIEITLTNTSSTIFDKLKKHRWHYLIDLGGNIELCKLNKNELFAIKMIVPYVAYLGG